MKILGFLINRGRHYNAGYSANVFIRNSELSWDKFEGRKNFSRQQLKIKLNQAWCEKCDCSDSQANINFILIPKSPQTQLVHDRNSIPWRSRYLRLGQYGFYVVSSYLLLILKTNILPDSLPLTSAQIPLQLTSSFWHNTYFRQNNDIQSCTK